jgi:hypothetical protein
VYGEPNNPQQYHMGASLKLQELTRQVAKTDRQASEQVGNLRK